MLTPGQTIKWWSFLKIKLQIPSSASRGVNLKVGEALEIKKVVVKNAFLLFE